MGWETPEVLHQLGLLGPYERAMETAFDAFHELQKEGVAEASYVAPLALTVRSLFKWNLRELEHFIRLRSFRNGNPSYRRLAQQCWRELDRLVPAIAALIPCDMEAYDVSRH